MYGATVGKGHLAVSDTLIDLRANPYGIGVNAAGGTNLGSGIVTADLDRLTIVGGTPSGTDIAGIASQGDGAGNGAAVKLRDSVISGIGIPVARLGRTGATATVTTDRSSYGASAGPSFDSGPGKLTEHNRLIVSPQFVGNGDFHLAAGSPLIDAGTPGSVPAGALDRDGRPRASDGNGDCARVSDIGAFEYQGTKVKAVAHAAATVAAGKPVAFSAAGSCVPGPEAATIRWRFDDGSAAAGASVAHAYTTPGRHTATLTVSDAHGHSAQASAAVTVTAPPAPPQITRLRVRHGRVHFRLSQNATVTLRIAKLGKRPRTTRKVTGHQGANTIRLRKTLKPGRYRLTAVATATATGQHSKKLGTRFTVR
jgi:PKD domain-containing protein